MVKKYQNKCSKTGVTTEVKIFHKLLHRDCSDKADPFFTNFERARLKKITIFGHFKHFWTNKRPTGHRSLT